MNAILNYLLSKTAVGRLLNEKKTIIGAVLVLLSTAVSGLEKLAVLFPEVGWIPQTGGSLSELLVGLTKFLDGLGISFLAVGLYHKNQKAKLPDL